MKKLILYSTPLLLLISCSSEITSTPTTSTCPEKPTTVLNEKDVEEIALDDKTLTKSAQASATKSIGYKFEAKSGQKFSFSTDSDVCVWRYSPDNQILKDGNLPQTGKYIIQLSALKGSKTFDINMTLGVLQASSTPTPSVSATTSSASITPSTTSPPPSTSTVDLTAQQAEDIVKQWLQAKPQIFGPPYDTSLVDKLATGKLHQSTTNPDPEVGPVAWLRSTNSYYKYNQSEIKQVINFSNSGRQPYIKVRIFEELYLYGRNGKIDRDNSGSSERNFIYFFEKDSSGTWKIYDYQKTN
jgi:ARC6-like, IMS domain